VIHDDGGFTGLPFSAVGRGRDLCDLSVKIAHLQEELGLGCVKRFNTVADLREFLLYTSYGFVWWDAYRV
jgi:hypothetical protein